MEEVKSKLRLDSEAWQQHRGQHQFTMIAVFLLPPPTAKDRDIQHPPHRPSSCVSLLLRNKMCITHKICQHVESTL